MRAPALLATAFATLLIAAPAASAQQPAPTPGTATTAPAAAPAPAVSVGAATGGAVYGLPNPATTATVPGEVATVLPTGLAAAPAGAPQEVRDAIAAANEIIGKPYVYGGGHTRTFRSRGYDCSGTVSYALKGADLLRTPLDSSRFMTWGARGAGDWITVYTNPGHAFVVIAGLRLDTSAAGDPSGDKGPRWRPALRSTKGFKARHPAGL